MDRKRRTKQLMKKNIAYALMIATALLCTLSVSSCYYDKKDILYGGGICDTVNVSYSQAIVPVLSMYCYSCHSEVTAGESGEGLILEGYNNLSIYLQQHEQTLVNSVKQNGLAKPMPDNAQKIDKCSIAFLEAWILQGKKNN
jgi:hypothetical protein